jgi:hypothetical protein
MKNVRVKSYEKNVKSKKLFLGNEDETKKVIEDIYAKGLKDYDVTKVYLDEESISVVRQYTKKFKYLYVLSMPNTDYSYFIGSNIELNSDSYDFKKYSGDFE